MDYCMYLTEYVYRTRAIISRGLCIFYPISKDHFLGGFSENSVLMYGLYSRATSNQERLMMARVRYMLGLENILKVYFSKMQDKYSVITKKILKYQTIMDYCTHLTEYIIRP